MDEEEFGTVDLAYANSEIRNLTLELMKIALQERKPFREVAREFVKNTIYLKNLIEEAERIVRSEL
jgi:hypothetical protein